MLKEKIISMIPSEYIRKLIADNPYWLKDCGYFDIIMAFGRSIEEKKALLELLLKEWDNFKKEKKNRKKTDYKFDLKICIDIFGTFLNVVNCVDRNIYELCLAINEAENHIPVMFLSDARRYIKENNSYYPNYTKYELLMYEAEHNSFNLKYRYILDRNGGITDVRYSDEKGASVFDDMFLMGYGNGIYVSVPYEPGDILSIGKDKYCLILNSKDKGYLECFTFNKNGEICFNEWHNGVYKGGDPDVSFMDIAFAAEKTDKIFTGNAAFMNELSHMIKKKQNKE